MQATAAFVESVQHGVRAASSGAGPAPSPHSHIAILDIVRGLAALTVAFYHIREVLWVGTRAYFGESPALSLAWLLSAATIPFVWGSIGVPIFFVLSGYVIHRRSALNLAYCGDPGLVARPFLLRRFVRIYPTFLAALILTLGLDLAAQALAPGNGKLGDMSFAAFMWNVASLQGIFSPAFGSNGALWTLAIEMQFYLVYPIALMIRRRVGAERMLALAALLSAAGYLLLETRNLQAFPSYYLSWWLGAYVADREAMGKRAIRGWPWFAIAFIGAGCALTIPHWAFAAQLSWAIGFAFLLPSIIQAGRSWRRGPLFRILSAFGAYSYSLYVVHLPIVVFFSSLWLAGVRSPSIYVAFAGFAATLVAAWIFYLVAERPFVRLLQRLP